MPRVVPVSVTRMICAHRRYLFRTTALLEHVQLHLFGICNLIVVLIVEGLSESQRLFRDAIAVVREEGRTSVGGSRRRARNDPA